MGATLPSAGKILIVEDEFLVALQLEDILADGGHEVVGIVPDAQSLGSLVQVPDVALVDLNLRDGLTGPAIVRDLSERYGARIIYVTANPGQIDEPAATALGIVQKPFTRQTILSAIAYALCDGASGERPAELEAVRQQVASRVDD